MALGAARARRGIPLVTRTGSVAVKVRARAADRVAYALAHIEFLHFASSV
jgi:hypothetical protein